jgi:outer membrane receptor for ferrienterochelin and colicins
MQMRFSGLIVGLFFGFTAAQGQVGKIPSADTLYGSANEIVVTATRTEKKLGNVAVPVTLISSKQITQAGSVRLADILQEQAGLFITTGFGAGVQMQGLNPDYTLILLNGEPLVGRTAGILDLNRITVGNIKQIEIVKGPSSSLYGSEAMAGVINIITTTPIKNELALSARYGSFNTSDVNATFNFSKNKFTYQGFANNYHTNGFSLRPNSQTSFVTPINRFTQQHQLGYQISDKTKLLGSVRFNRERITNEIAVENNGVIVNSQGKESNDDANFSATLMHKFSNSVKTSAKLYATTFASEQELATTSGAPYTDYFKQHFLRFETQTDVVVSKNLETSIGAGYLIDRANSTRYDKRESTKENSVGYAFFQSEWKPLEKLVVIGGARYDHNALFAAAFSPKLALKYSITNKINVKASVGRGFKAPDFRQLYLNFTNTAAGGYSVFGAIEAQKIITALKGLGQIASIEQDYYSLAALQPEFSTGYHASFDYTPSQKHNVSVSLFYNNINNLIDSRLVAYRPGGAQIFSYLNVKTAFTKGVELNTNHKIGKYYLMSSGYQFLLSGDASELDKIEEGKVFTRDENGYSRRLYASEYVGLPNRSKHQFNLKLQYQKEQVFATLRALYRSSWYVTDTDGNGLYNTNDSKALGFVQFNATIGLPLTKNITMQAGCNNIFNYRDAINMPNFMGRTGFISINYSIKQSIEK